MRPLQVLHIVCFVSVSAVAGAATAADMRFDEKTMTSLLARCQKSDPPLSSKECMHRVQGMAEGWCIARYEVAAEAKTCVSGKYQEIRDSARALAEKMKDGGSP